MFSNKDEIANYSRGGEFLENFMSGNPLEFCKRWMCLGDIHNVIADMEEFYKYNKYRGKPLKYDYGDAIYYVKSNMQDAVIFDDIYMTSPAVTFNDTLDVDRKKELEKKIREGAIL